MIKLDLFGDNDGVCNINRHGVWSVDFDLKSMDTLRNLDSVDDSDDDSDDEEIEP